jgi:hypothetical protein
MLINDIKPSSGNIVINGKNINELVSYLIDGAMRMPFSCCRNEI